MIFMDHDDLRKIANFIEVSKYTFAAIMMLRWDLKNSSKIVFKKVPPADIGYLNSNMI